MDLREDSCSVTSDISAESIDPLLALVVAESAELETHAWAEHADPLILFASHQNESEHPECKMKDEDHPTYSQAMKGPFKKEYEKAIQKEYASLEANKVFSEPCVLPKGFKPLDTKMVLKRKEEEFPGQERRFKARLCTRGFKQISGIDYFETFSPVASLDSLRIFLTLMATMDYEIDAVDVITAFLLAPLTEEIYIKIPDGYANNHLLKGKVLKLQKALYGLKQAPMEWNKTIDEYLKSIGFTPTQSDRCLYVGTYGGQICYILLYVDDMLIATKDRKTMQHLKESVNGKFPIEDKGPVTFFLNMHLSRHRENRTITLHQLPKINKLLNDPRLSDSEKRHIRKTSKTPASSEEQLSVDQCPTSSNDTNFVDPSKFKSFVGMLLYISITARPDITTATSMVARFAHNPGKKHWEAVLRILRYLQGSKSMVLQLGGQMQYPTLLAYADADWATDKDKRVSRSGFVIFISNSLVIWSSKLQRSQALSSTEAEYISLTSCARLVIWARTLLAELGFDQEQPSVIYEDNKGCIDIATSSKSHPAVKHIDLRHHFIRDRIQVTKDITLVKIGTTEMIADMFTKALVFFLFNKHRTRLGLIQD